MLRSSIADLEAAVATGSLERWLEGMPDAARPELRRALDIDRPLWAQHPHSLASCLLARTSGIRELRELHARWMRELDERAAPWIASLRPLPVENGLLAELHDGDDLALAEGGRLSFESEEVVCLRAYVGNSPGARRRGCLRWSWTRGEVTIIPDLEAGGPARDGYPKVETSGWGPAFLTASPGAAKVKLPRPAESTADAHVMADGARVLVYGSLEDYAGGYVHIVDVATLAIERSLETRRPVKDVHECERRDLLLVSTHGGLVAWSGDAKYELSPRRGGDACLSPSGTHVAVLDGSLRIWSMEMLVKNADEHPPSGFPTCFDPDGERLLSGRSLFDGHSGQRLAELTPSFGEYLEGGPAAPWLYFGAQYLASMHSGMEVWDSRTGKALRAPEGLTYPHWYSLAYDRAGTRFAALHHNQMTVVLHAVPSGRILRELTFDIEGSAIAMSPDGETIAIQRGGAVEVRTADGALVQRHGDASIPVPVDVVQHRCEPVLRHGPSRVAQYSEATLRFSRDGRRIARFLPDGWLIWTLGEQRAEYVAADQPLDGIADFAPPWPADWTVEADSKTLFTHRPSGTRIALPAKGRWMSNPANPRILACRDMHVELRSAGSAIRPGTA